MRRQLIVVARLAALLTVRLVQLKLAQRAVRGLTHERLPARRVCVAETALQGVGVEESSAPRCLECNRGHTLCHLRSCRVRTSVSRGTDDFPTQLHDRRRQKRLSRKFFWRDGDWRCEPSLA